MKRLATLGVIFMFLLSIFLFIATTYNVDIKETLNQIINSDKNISLAITPKSVSIIKTGTPVRKKVITSKDDMEKVKNFVESIHLQKKLNDSIKGWAYSINILSTDDKNYALTIGSCVSYDNAQYTMDSGITEEFDHIYNGLNYTEIDPLQ